MSAAACCGFRSIQSSVQAAEHPDQNQNWNRHAQKPQQQVTTHDKYPSTMMDLSGSTIARAVRSATPGRDQRFRRTGAASRPVRPISFSSTTVTIGAESS